jgi:hypothetical protein
MSNDLGAMRQSGLSWLHRFEVRERAVLALGVAAVLVDPSLARQLNLMSC